MNVKHDACSSRVFFSPMLTVQVYTKSIPKSEVHVYTQFLRTIFPQPQPCTQNSSAAMQFFHGDHTKKCTTSILSNEKYLKIAVSTNEAFHNYDRNHSCMNPTSVVLLYKPFRPFNYISHSTPGSLISILSSSSWI
jgi:hypothetical protein